MDRIAREGALFRSASTARPVCSPSRANMLMIISNTRRGIANWIDSKKEPDLGLAPSEIL